MTKLVDVIPDQNFLPEPQAAGSGLKPPSRRTGIGMFDSNGGMVPPIEGQFAQNPDPLASERVFFNALNAELEKEINDPTSEPFLLRDLDRLMPEFGLDSTDAPVSKAGLIKRRSLGILDYIRSMPNLRDIFGR